MSEAIGHVTCECKTVIGYDSILRQIGALTCPVCMKTVQIPQEKEKKSE